MTNPVSLRRPFPFLLHRTMTEVMMTDWLVSQQKARCLTGVEMKELHRLARRMGAAGIGPGGIAWGKPK